MATEHVIEIVGQNKSAIDAIEAVKNALIELKQEADAVAKTLKDLKPDTPKSTPAPPKSDTSQVVRNRKQEADEAERTANADREALQAILNRQKALAQLKEERRQERIESIKATATWKEMEKIVALYYKRHSMGEVTFRNIARNQDKLAERFGKMSEETQWEFLKAATNVAKTEGLKLESAFAGIEKKWISTVDKIRQYGLEDKIFLRPIGEIREKVMQAGGLNEEMVRQYRHIIDQASRQADILGPIIGSDAHRAEVAKTQKSFMDYVRVFNQVRQEAAYTKEQILELVSNLDKMDVKNLKQLQADFTVSKKEMQALLDLRKMFDTGKIDAKQFRESASVIKRLSTYIQSLEKLGRGPGAAAFNMERVIARLQKMEPEKVSKIVDAWGRKNAELAVEVQKMMASATPFERTMERVGKAASWFLATTALVGMVKALRFTIGTISNMQVAVIDLQKVMNEATTNFKEMRQAALDLGQQLGRLPEDAMKAMSMFARQGREQAEVIELTKVALIATNIAEMSLTESVENLTAAILQWELSATDAIRLLDTWNEVSNRNAVTASVLAEAFSHTSTMAKQLGLDIHELNALITILATTTGKSGGEIGRSLRFAFNRIFLPAVQTTLSNVLGLSVFEPGTGELRDFSSILREVAEAWQDLSDAQRAAIARAFGGTRHIQDMQILFEKLTTIGIKVATDSLYSFNSAVRENQRYMQSLERQFASLQAGLKEVAITLGDAGVLGLVQLVTDMAKTTVGLFNALPGHIKSFVSIAITAKIAQFGLQKAFGDFPFTLNQARQAFDVLKGAIKGFISVVTTGRLIANIGGIAEVLAKLKAAIAGVLGPWGLLVAALLGIGMIWGGVRKRFTDLTESIDEQIGKMNELTRQYQLQIQEAERIAKNVADIEAGTYSEIRTIEEKDRAYNNFRRTFGALYKDYDEMAQHIEAFVRLKQLEADEVRNLSERTRKVLKDNIAREYATLQKELEQKREYALEAMTLAEDAKAKGKIFLTPEVVTNLRAGGFMSVSQLLMREIYNILDLLGFDFAGKALLGFWTEVSTQMIKDLTDLEQRQEKLKQKFIELSDLEKTAFERLSQRVSGEPESVFGEYITGLSWLLSESLEVKNQLQMIVEDINEQTGQAKELVDLYKTYWETTGMGLTEYAKIFEQTESLLDALMTHRYLVAKTMVDRTPYEQTGTHTYYLALRQAIEAQEHFIKRLDDQRDALRKAFDMGIIGAMDFYTKLVEIDRLDVFTRKRQQIREMTEELKTGTVSAIESLFKGMMMGEENVLEQFRETIRGVRAGVLAKGLTGWITESEYFRTTMARQQHLIAELFGAGAAEKTIPVEERQLDILKYQRDMQSAILDEAEIQSEELKELNNKAKALLEGGGAPPPGRPGAIGELNNVLKQVSQLTQRTTLLSSALDKAKERVVDFADALVGAKKSTEDASQSLEKLGNIETGWAKDGIPLPAQPLTWLGGGVVPLPEQKLQWAQGVVPLPEEKLSWELKTVPLPADVLAWAQSNVPLPDGGLLWDGEGVVPLPEQELTWENQGIVPLPKQEVGWADGGLVPVPQRPLNWVDAYVNYPKEELKWSTTLVDVPATQQFELKIEGQPAIRFTPDPYVIKVESQPQAQWHYNGKDVTDSTVPLPIPPPPSDLENKIGNAYTALTDAMAVISVFGLSLQDTLLRESDSALVAMGDFFASMRSQFEIMSELAKLSLLPPEELEAKPSAGRPGIIGGLDDVLGQANRLAQQQITIEVSNESVARVIEQEIERSNQILKRRLIEVISDGRTMTFMLPAMAFGLLSAIFGMPGIGLTLGFAGGGHTGVGGKLEPAGIVHKGEWVAPKWLVEKYPELIAILENIRKRGYQAGGLVAGSWEARLDRQFQWMVNPQAYQLRQEQLLKDTQRELRQAEREAWDYGVMLFSAALTPYLGQITKGLDRVRDAVVDGVGVGTGEKLAQLLEYKTHGIPVAAPLGRAGGNIIRYGFGRALQGMGFLHYFGLAMYLVQIYDAFKREFAGAGLKQLLGFDAIFGDRSIWDVLFQGGGFTGKGNLDEIAGFVHKGEWVAPAWQVRRYPQLIAMMEGIRKRGYQSGGGEFQLYGIGSGQGILPGSRYESLERAALEAVQSISRIESEVADIAVYAENQVQESKSLGQRIYEFFFGARGESELDKYRRQFEKSGYQGKYADELIKTMKVMVGEPTPGQLASVMDVVIKKGLIPTDATFAEFIDVLTDRFDEFATEFKEKDKALYERLQAGRERLEIQTVSQALKDMTQVQNAVAAATMMIAETDSQLAGQLGFAAGLVQGTGLEAELASAFEKIGLKTLPSDIISGLGLVLGGMSQNVKEAGSGIANILMGISSITGVGASWIPVLSPLLNMFFGGPKEKPKEAEKIGNIRHFIATSDMGYQMADRFYLSGRHAAMLRGDLSGPVWGGAVSQRFDRVEININGAGDPQAVAQEVKRILTVDIPSSYSREVRRGLVR